MGLFSTLLGTTIENGLRGQGVHLRPPETDDCQQWIALRRESRAFLEPWEPTWDRDDLTPYAFRQRVRRYREMRESDQAYPYFIFSEAEGELLGAVTLSNVRRGAAQLATMGYWIGQRHARKGYMTRALSVLLPHAFTGHGLHRVEAACLPRNEASIRLLQRVGFEREGYARAYLKIAGRWEDHLLFAKLR